MVPGNKSRVLRMVGKHSSLSYMSSCEEGRVLSEHMEKETGAIESGNRDTKLAGSTGGKRKCGVQGPHRPLEIKNILCGVCVHTCTGHAWQYTCGCQRKIWGLVSPSTLTLTWVPRIEVKSSGLAAGDFTY